MNLSEDPVKCPQDDQVVRRTKWTVSVDPGLDLEFLWGTVGITNTGIPDTEKIPLNPGI